MVENWASWMSGAQNTLKNQTNTECRLVCEQCFYSSRKLPFSLFLYCILRSFVVRFTFNI